MWCQAIKECGALDSCFGLVSLHQQNILHSPIDETPQVKEAVSDPVLVVLNDIDHYLARPLWNLLIRHPSMRGSEPKLLSTHTVQRPVHKPKSVFRMHAHGVGRQCLPFCFKHWLYTRCSMFYPWTLVLY